MKRLISLVASGFNIAFTVLVFTVFYTVELSLVELKKTEILPGITYEAQTVTLVDGAAYRYVLTSVDLNNKNIEIYQPVPNKNASVSTGHFKLGFPDLHIKNHKLKILINTTPFNGDYDHSERSETEVLEGIRGEKRPFPGWKGYPGREVWVTEPVFSEGVASHIPARASLLWFSHAGRVNISQGIDLDGIVKLTQNNANRAKYAAGMEVIQIQGGAIYKEFYKQKYRMDKVNYRSFAGIDAERNILFLMAFENVTTYEMLTQAQKSGIKDGGQFDSGNASWLIFGDGFDKIKAHSGIRGGRLVASFLGIKYNVTD